MQLQIDINSVKSDIFLELLNIFKKDNMINDYKIINTKNDAETELLSDLYKLNDTLNDAKNGLGYKTSKTINIQDI